MLTHYLSLFFRFAFSTIKALVVLLIVVVILGLAYWIGEKLGQIGAMLIAFVLS